MTEITRYTTRDTEVRSNWKAAGDNDHKIAAGTCVTLNTDAVAVQVVDGHTWISLSAPSTGWVLLDHTSDRERLGTRIVDAESRVEDAIRQHGKASVQYLGAKWNALVAPRKEHPVGAAARRTVHRGGKAAVTGTAVYGILVTIAQVAGESPTFEAWLHKILTPLLPYIAIVGGLLGPVLDPIVPDPPPPPPDPAPTVQLDAANGDQAPDKVEALPGWNIHSCPDPDCPVISVTDLGMLGTVVRVSDDAVWILVDFGSVTGWVSGDGLETDV